MGKNMILLKDNDDCEYIYGAIIIEGNIFDIQLLQKRLDDMRDEVGYEEFDGNGEDILKAVLEKFEEYKNVEYIPYGNYYVEV